jgi:hypothetical protein
LGRCDDGLFFLVPPLASDALLTTLHPFLENVLQTVYCKVQEDSGTGSFDLLITLNHLEIVVTAARLIASPPYTCRMSCRGSDPLFPRPTQHAVAQR